MGARGLRIKLKGHSIGVGMLQAMGPRKEATQGREEMNHGTLWYSKWELESEESGSQWTVGKFQVWYSLLHPH